jgi:nucleoside-diphosphate-sugar epimerase
MGTGQVLEFCRMRSIPLVYMSAYLYGRPLKLPISEDDAIRPNNPYAHSKYLAEQLCEFYAHEFGVKTIILRPFNIFGPGQSEQFLVPLIIRQALERNEIKVKTLSPKRDYIYLDDVIDAAILAMKLVREPFAVYNIGSGYSASVLSVIRCVMEVMGTDLSVVSEDEARRNEINDVFADISRANRELGWYPRYSLADGIRKTIEYEKSRIYA